MTELPPTDASRVTHTFDGDPAFQSDCRSGPSSLYWFYVVLRDRGGRTIDVRLAKFRVLDRDGRTRAPLDITDRARDPQHFIPATFTLGPQDSMAGWLSAQAGENFVPRRIEYPEGPNACWRWSSSVHTASPRG